MFARVCVLFVAFHCISVKAGMPPVECKECDINYLKDVNPTEIMGCWYVVSHTDNLPTPSNADCLKICFGRRCDMQSNMRMDVAAQVEGDDALVMRTSIKASSKAPLKVTIGTIEDVFPDKMMITSFLREVGCMAIWTCKNYKSTCQKAAWVLCKTPDVDKSVIEKMTKDVVGISKISLSYLLPAPIEKCDV